MLKAIAFDAFGTMVDIFDKRRPYQAIAKTGQRTPAISPLTAPIALQEYARQCAAPWDDAWAADLAAELASVAPYPETIDVLATLRARGLKTAVASNLALPYGRPVIEQLGGWLDVTCFSFYVGTVKPDAAFYAALCQRLDCAPDEVLMVGDTWRCDYDGATAAGLNAIHLDRRGNGTPEQRAVAIRDLRGVLDWR
jgi:haloacid dehalogenase superfamily, subfamily IA, variant 1 with third motif having Dx(3-4)D or Dx(3-4)E